MVQAFVAPLQRLKALTAMAFKKGKSGNPGWRVKIAGDKPFREALRMALLEAGDNFKQLRAVADALVTRALEGDVAAIRELADRTDGKVAQAVQADVKRIVTVGLVDWRALDSSEEE